MPDAQNIVRIEPKLEGSRKGPPARPGRPWLPDPAKSRRRVSQLDAEDPLQQIAGQQAQEQERRDPMYPAAEDAKIPSGVGDLDG